MLRLPPCAALSFLASAPAAQTVKLNDPPLQPVFGIVESFFVGKSGTRGVYLADQEALGARELYGVPLDGSAPAVKLSPPLGGLHIGRGLALSADGSRVAFLLGGSTFATIHAAPTDGSSPAVPLASIDVEDLNSPRPELSPDGERVVFREDETSLSLSSVRADGSEPPIVLSSGTFVPLFEISADSTRVVFVRSSAGRRGLFSVPIDGSTGAVELNDLLPPSGDVDFFQLSPDGAHAVYSADQETDDVFELFSVPIDRSTGPVKLNRPLVAGGSAGHRSDGFAISSDGARVVYLVEQDRAELYSSPIDGSASPVRLSGTLASSRDVTKFTLAPDGRAVVFLVDRDADEVFELYLAPITGGGPYQLSEPLVPGGDVFEFAISSDSEHVVYRADQEQDQIFEIFSAPLGKVRRAGATRAVKLSRPLVAGGGVRTFQISLAGRRVVYRADALVDERMEDFSVPIAGGPSVRLTPELGFGGSASGITAVPGERGLFTARLSTNEGRDLHSVPLDGHAASLVLNGPLALGPTVSSVAQLQVSPDGRQAVYLVDQEIDERYELYSVPSDGSAAPLKLSGSIVPGGSVGGGFGPPPAGSFQIGPDGARLAYLADQDTNGVNELYGVPLDGSSPAVRLNDAFGAGAGVLHGMRFSPDASRVVYRAHLDAVQRSELFSVPADGSAGPVRLNGTITIAAGDVEPDFAVSADGSRVVYRSDETMDGKLELFSAPLDGSAPRTRLHGGMPGTRDVLSFRIDPTGQRVLFIGDLNTEDANELYSAPIGGGASPIRLNTALASGRAVTDTRISPDGSRVVYLADQLSNDRFELFGVPIDGSSAPVKLSGTMTFGGDVLSFEIGPHGGRVVYLADQDVAGRPELFSAPRDGSTPVVKLSGLSGAVKEFALTGGAARVVYRADRNGVAELFLAPLDGSLPPRRLSTPLPSRSVASFALDAIGFQAVYESRFTFGSSELFRVLLDGDPPAESITGGLAFVAQYSLLPKQRVLHRSDAESAGVIELFSTRLPRGPRSPF